MNVSRFLAVLAISAFTSDKSACPALATEPIIERMPAKLETEFALSALPSDLRGQATVYLLDPKKGYQLSRQGTSGITCLVERTVWEHADFRNDIYFPLCYDAAGSKTYARVIMDVAALRIQGTGPLALKAEIEKRYRDKVYTSPDRAGVSYMVAPVMRVAGLPPDMKVRTLSMPHLMFYAPNLTNEDIGVLPDRAHHASNLFPFVDRQGVAQQTYMIQLIGEAEKAQVLANEKTLIKDLCAYRTALCLPEG